RQAQSRQERPEPVAGLDVQAPPPQPADDPEGVAEGPAETARPTAPGAGAGSVQERQDEDDDPGDAPSPGDRPTRVDQLGRRGVRPHELERDERERDPQDDAPDPRGLPHADEPLAQSALAGDAGGRFEEIPQAEE